MAHQINIERAHGTRCRYVWGPVGQQPGNGCRCFECSAAAVLYEKRRTARKARGWNPYVDNSEARSHIAWLSTQGIGLRTVAEVSGVSRSALRHIKNGTRTKSKPEIVDAILALHRGIAADNAHVPNQRIVEMVAELKTMGYSQRSLAGMLGYKAQSLQLSKSGLITPAKAKRIEALYKALTAKRDAGREFDAARQREYRQRQVAV